jgi:LITAF-like zinc ribbon domain
VIEKFIEKFKGDRKEEHAFLLYPTMTEKEIKTHEGEKVKILSSENVKYTKEQCTDLRKNTKNFELKCLKKHERYYKTSIEKWKPVGNEKIYCPRCQSCKRPTVKVSRNHITSSKLSSAFVLSCWPLCFSPCYLPEPSFENLHCKICNYHLGVYDHENEKIIPNEN